MFSRFALFFVTAILASCAENSSIDTQINSPDLEFINAEFQYIKGINQYGNQPNTWVANSKLTFYYISDSETGKPQGRLIWKYQQGKKPLKAWWRFDPSTNAISIFGNGGTAGHLSLSDYHVEVKQNWRTIHIDEEGHLIMDETNQDPVIWTFERLATAEDWAGQ